MILKYFNIIIAFLIFLVAVGSVARMNGVTPNAVRVAIILILTGALGQVIVGLLPEHWDYYIDSVMYCGVVTLLICNLRSPAWITDRLRNWLARTGAPAWIVERWRETLSVTIMCMTAVAVLLHISLVHA